jgi:hypothetical protein
MLRFRTTLLSIAAAAMTMVSAGCVDTVKAPIEGRADPYVPAQVHVTSMELRRHTAVGEPKLSRDDAGLLFVTVPVRSTADMKLYVDYRYTFFDRNGQPLNTSSWMHVTLPANTPDQISFNSTSPRAADFQLDLRDSE